MQKKLLVGNVDNGLARAYNVHMNNELHVIRNHANDQAMIGTLEVVDDSLTLMRCGSMSGPLYPMFYDDGVVTPGMTIDNLYWNGAPVNVTVKRINRVSITLTDLGGDWKYPR